MQQQNPAPLLRLPAELRNRIYFLALINEHDNIFHLSKETMEPPLLSVSKQLRSETSGIFYSNTILQFSDPAVCIRRLTTICPKNLKLISELRYDTSETCVSATSWRTAFRDLPGLDEDSKLEGLRDELKKKGVDIGDHKVKARINIAGTARWTSDPLTACLDASSWGLWSGG